DRRERLLELDYHRLAVSRGQRSNGRRWVGVIRQVRAVGADLLEPVPGRDHVVCIDGPAVDRGDGRKPDLRADLAGDLKLVRRDLPALQQVSFHGAVQRAHETKLEPDQVAVEIGIGLNDGNVWVEVHVAAAANTGEEPPTALGAFAFIAYRVE